MATGDSFWNALIGIRDPENPEASDNLPVDPFWDALSALAIGWNTKAQVVSYFGMTADQEAGLNEIIGWYNAQPDVAAKERFIYLGRCACRLGERGTPGYNTIAGVKAKLSAL